MPLDRVQVCSADDDGGKKGDMEGMNGGTTKTIRTKDLERRLDRGDCRLPTCDFNNIFQSGDACDRDDDDGDGVCDNLNDPRMPATTARCVNPF